MRIRRYLGKQLMKYAVLRVFTTRQAPRESVIQRVHSTARSGAATYNTSLWRYNKKGALSVKPSLASRTSLNHELPKRRARCFLFHRGGQSLCSVYRFMSITIEVYRTAEVLLESVFVYRAKNL
ncbi:hypothetical protein L3X38_000187 (mitochondrion) [Prunus dulcis]|uniref:Uncharacterized protein n=2 Tax=Prunus TaxID=3754 RepID=A0AAD4UT83_PRUDU|nr:hypothetical protein L3X38_000187 [Prunus dulcis]